MSDLISRQALLESMKSGCDMQDLYLPIHFFDFVEDAPTVEARPVVHGEWIGDTCSACGMNWNENMVNNADDWGYFEPLPNFCQNCGADMRKKEE